MSQEQLRDPVRARGEEAGGVLQHLTQVNPRKAELIKVSVPVNARPNIQPRSEWYWGRQRPDIGHSYFKRSPQVRYGRVEEGNEEGPHACGEVGSPHTSEEAGGAKGCVKKMRKRHAVRKMKVGPSEPSCRGGLQTAMSCFGQKAAVVNVMVKRRD